jgi:hypothetical protein
MRALAVTLVFAGGLSGAVPAAEAAYRVERIVGEGDPAPAGGTIGQMYSPLALDASGRVTFIPTLDDGITADFHVLTYTGSTGSIDVAAGDPAPGLPGFTVDFMFDPGRNDSGDVVFYGQLPEASGDDAVFVDSVTAGRVVAKPGDALPGGATLTDPDSTPTIDAAGRVLYSATIDPGDGSAVRALLLDTAGTSTIVAREGGPAAPGVGGTISVLQYNFGYDIAGDGSAYYWAEVSGGTSAAGIFRASGGIHTPLVRLGDPVPPPRVGTFTYLSPIIAASSNGNVVFIADVTEPGESFPSSFGIYAVVAGGVREIVSFGDPLPGSGGGTFGSDFGYGPPDINAAGEVAFSALVLYPDLSDKGALYVGDGSTLRLVALAGDPILGSPGESFGAFDAVKINDAGRVAWTGSSSPGGQAIFTAAPAVAVPALPLPGLIALAGALGVSGVASRRRNR